MLSTKKKILQDISMLVVQVNVEGGFDAGVTVRVSVLG